MLTGCRPSECSALNQCLWKSPGICVKFLLQIYWKFDKLDLAAAAANFTWVLQVRLRNGYLERKILGIIYAEHYISAFIQSINQSTDIVYPLQVEQGCITIVNKTLKTEYILDAVKRLWKIKCVQFLFKSCVAGFIVNVSRESVPCGTM